MNSNVATTQWTGSTFAVRTRLAVIGGVLAGLGLLISLAALMVDEGTSRVAYAWLWGFSFVWTVVLGCLFFVGLHHVTHAIWSVVVRRIAEIFASGMWLVALMFVPLVAFLFSSDHVPFPWTDPALLENDQILGAKQVYLNRPFFISRAIGYFALWILFAWLYVRASVRQDDGIGGEEATLRLRRISPGFMLVFAVTATFATIDWLMSLSPKWFSTIIGVYIFGGMAATALAAITITTILLHKSGAIETRTITDHHLYNLGALLFTFACFWAYIAFSQYMLIWYANMPEESFYFVTRLEQPWIGISILLALVRFVIPFLVLLSRRAKVNPTILLWISVLTLLGQWIDLYWLIMPERPGASALPGWQEFGPPLLLTGLLLLHVSRFMARHAVVATGDPLFEQSRHFRL